MQVSLPAWLHNLPEEEQSPARARFLMRLAALYHSEGGKMNTLSIACEKHPSTLSILTNISPELAIGLEEVLGREMFPRELFRPDIFNTPDAVVE